MTNISTRSITVFSALAFLMLATRADHFGSIMNLPDASLAVFFMAGFLLSSRLVFPVLCILAGGIDYWMIEYNGVSAFCVTPAYVFLLPTYFVMWGSGKLSCGLDLDKRQQWFPLAVIVAISLLLAHLISSGSFYLLAPYFTDHSLTEFAQRTLRYFPRYFLVTAGYLIPLLAFWKVVAGTALVKMAAGRAK